MYEDEKKLKIDNNLNRTEKLMKEQSNATNKQMKIMNAKRIKQSHSVWLVIPFGVESLGAFGSIKETIQKSEGEVFQSRLKV